MMKTALAMLVVCGTISAAEAMPVSAVSASKSLPVVKAAVVVKKVIRRRPAAVVVRRPPAKVVKKTIIRR